MVDFFALMASHSGSVVSELVAQVPNIEPALNERFLGKRHCFPLIVLIGYVYPYICFSNCFSMHLFPAIQLTLLAKVSWQVAEG